MATLCRARWGSGFYWGITLVGAAGWVFLCGAGSARALESGSVPRIVPVDESSGNPVFFVFWQKFQQAVKDRDGEFVVSVVSEKVKLSFGESSGKADFVTNWRPHDPKGPLWKELDEIIRLGGSLGGDGGTVFSAPYAFGNWPDRFDVFDYVFVAGASVRFRAEPNSSGKVIRTVSWEIMKKDYGDDDWRAGDWARLRAYDGQIGYVHLDFARSPIDFRIGFSEDGKGGFQLDYLIAGD